jgi:hypothetical protein
MVVTHRSHYYFFVFILEFTQEKGATSGEGTAYPSEALELVGFVILDL